MNPGVAGHVRPSVYIPQPIGAVELKEPLQIQDVVLHHLRTPEEIRSIIDLRDEIDLSVHQAAGARQFAESEKKRTNADSSSDSNSAASGSARFASFRWATN